MSTKLFVCTQLRHAPNPHSCGNSGSDEIATRLEQAIRQSGLAVEVERTSCMSMCVNGPNVRLLPTGKNWHRVDAKAVDEIVVFLSSNQNQTII